MNQVRHILQKDLRALKYEAAAVSGLIILAVALPALELDHMWTMLGLEGLVKMLAPVAWITLPVLLMQTDRLSSLHEDWRIRPIRRRDLLVAKCTFILLVAGIPLAFFDTAYLQQNGFRPVEHWTGMGLHVAASLAVVALAMLALGAVMPGVGQAMLWLVASVITVNVVTMTAGALFPSSFDWPNALLMCVLISAVSALALWRQFTGRGSIVNRFVLLGGWCVGVAAALCLPWSLSVAARRCFAVERTPETVARLVPAGPISSTRSRPSDEDHRDRIVIPLAMTDIPGDQRIRPVRLSVEVDAGARRYHNDWASRLKPVPDPAGFTPHIDFPLAEVAQLRNASARITVRVSSAVLRRGPTHKIPIGHAAISLPGLGRCLADAPGGWNPSDGHVSKLIVTCMTAYQRPAFVTARLYSTGSTATISEHTMEGNDELSPLPYSFGLTPTRVVYLQLSDVRLPSAFPTAPGTRPEYRVALESDQLVDFVERSYTTTVPRLGDLLEVSK